MFDAIIGMVTGTLFVTYFLMIPFAVLLYSIAEEWVKEVTNNEVTISQKPYKLYKKYYHEFFQGCVFTIYTAFLTVGTLFYFIAPPTGNSSFSDEMTYLEWCIMILFEFPAKAGAWASEVILIILVYTVSTWAAKWVYSLSSRVNKLEKKEESK